MNSADVIVETVDTALCEICSDSKFSHFAEGKDFELETCKNKWQVVSCDTCDHIFLNPRPSSSELLTIYPSNYYSYNYEKVNIVARGAKSFLDYVKFRGILKSLDRPMESFLDIGCGNGRYLDLVKSKFSPNAKIYGVELDEDTSSRLRQKGYRVFSKPVEEINGIEDSTLDFVTMFHVIEHVSSPGLVFKKVHGWLKPDGIFAVETPNLDSIDAKIFKSKYWGGYHFPRHWHFFKIRTATQLAKQNGFVLHQVKYATGHSFWAYSFHHYLRYELKMMWLSKFFDPMKSLLPVAFFTFMDLIRAKLGMKTSAMLLIFKKAKAPLLEYLPIQMT